MQTPKHSAAAAPDATEDNSKQTLRDKLIQWAPLIMVLAGVVFLLYPVLATQHNNAEQQRIASEYSVQADEYGPDAVAEQLRKAEEYNDTLAAMPILDPWIEEQRPDAPGYRAYLDQLNLNPVMSRVTVPKLHIDLPLYHGTENSTLDKGLGHLFGTSLPVGGTSTHSVITGHSGLGNATMFDDLRAIELDDAFYIETLGRTMKYKVVDIKVVLPNETDSLIKQPGRDLVTLITCTPYGVNSHRLLVMGERVPIDPQVAKQEQNDATPTPMAWWMIAALSVAAIVVAILLFLLVRALLARRRKQDDDNESPAATQPQGKHRA